MAVEAPPKPAKPANRVIENAELFYRNFAGRAQQFNNEGNRNFCVFLDPEVAAEMERELWNVKYTKPREDGDEPRPFIQVSVKFGTRPPNVVLIRSKGRTKLDEDTVGIIDAIDIKQADIVLNPYPYSFNGRAGLSAYLKSAFITLDEDELELKYMQIPETNQSDPTTSSIASDYNDDLGEED